MGEFKFEPKAPINLDDQWRELAANPNDAHSHERFLNDCTSQNKLAFAAACYKSFLATDPHHPIALAARQKLIGRMIAVGMAHFQSMEPELISEKDVNRLGLSLIGLASVLVSFSIKTYVIGFVLFLLSLIWTAWTARRSFSKKPATFMSLARRRAITAWLTVIDALYSAFVVVHELKYGKNVAAVFMVVFFCLMTYLILLAFTVFGPAPFRGMASGAFRRAYSKWWNQ